MSTREYMLPKYAGGWYVIAVHVKEKYVHHTEVSYSLLFERSRFRNCIENS